MKTWLPIVILLCGCGSDAPPKSTPNSNVDGDDMGTRADADVTTEDDCSGLEVLHDGACVVPQRMVGVYLTAIANLPTEFGDPRVCAAVLEDEEQARSFVTSNRLIERTDDCLVTEQLPVEERAVWPYVSDPDGWTSATVRQGDEEWVLETVSEVFDECVTAPGSFEFGGTYEIDVPTGGADASQFPRAIVIPDDPQHSCPTAVSGEPLEFTWTPSGATTVSVSASIADIEIDCEVSDTGSFTIPAELTGMLPETGSQVVAIRPRNIERIYNPETQTLSVFVGEAWNACDYVF